MSACLGPEDLERLRGGLMDEAEEATTRLHLKTCAVCSAAYATFLTGRVVSSDLASVPEQATMTVSPGEPDDSSPAAVAARHYPKIEGYEITGVLGQGGMGVVYRAVQTKLNRVVALKVLPMMVGAASPSAVSRFRREATAAARLHHTHIIPIYDFGESRDAYYYAMELITGRALDDLIRHLAENDASRASPVRLVELLTLLEVRMGQEAGDQHGSGEIGTRSSSGSSLSGKGRAYFLQVAKWMADAADALGYAHAAGIIHRDIKPGNLILSTDGRIMIADFGLAKLEGDRSVTATGAFLGSLRYVSPEQAMAKRVRVDHRTDVYSLGATMYELLCFRPAFSGEDEKEIFGAIIAREPTPPRKINYHVPTEMETICLKCLEKSPDMRYATSGALAEDLRRYGQDLPIKAKRPGPIARARKFARRHRAGVIAAASIVLLALAVPVIAHLWRQRTLEGQRRAAADWIVDARDSESQQNWRRAAACYEKAIEVYPESAEALKSFARMKKEQFNAQPDAPLSLIEEGVELCDRALRIDASDVALWNTKGVLLKILERHDEAIAAYQHATRVSPGFGAAWENLGIALALKGELEEAVPYVLRSAELAGTHESQCEYPWRNLAALELHLGMPAAFEHLTQALACNRQDANTLALQTRIFLDLDGHVDFARAAESANYADFLAEGKDPRIKRISALVHLRQGDWEKAAEYASEAIALNDELAAADHLIIAIAKARMGSPDIAREALTQADETWPPDLGGPESFRVTAPAGILWVESADELEDLRTQAQSLVAPLSP